MKKILILALILNSLLFAAKSSESDKKSRTEKQIQIEMEKEKKYSKEQTFYMKKDYDLKGAEVNKDSLDSIPDLEIDDFDMDDVY